MAYADLQSIHTPATGNYPPASWGTQARDNDEWEARNKPHARVYHSATQVNTGALTALVFDSERVDVGGMHSVASNTSRMTVPSGGGGFYLMGGSAKWANTNVTGYRYLALVLNAGNQIASQAAPATTLDHPLTVMTGYQLAAGDYVELSAYQTTGVNLNIDTEAADSPEFWICWYSL